MLGNGYSTKSKITVAIKLDLKLLFVAFAAIALMLALHQPSAAAQSPELAAPTIHIDAHHEDCVGDHPMHSTNCCSMLVGLAAPVCKTATLSHGRPVHGVIGGSDPAIFNVPSKVYRPPRVI